MRRYLTAFALLLSVQAALSHVRFPLHESVELNGAHVWRDPSLWDVIKDRLDPPGYAAYRASVTKSIQTGVVQFTTSTATSATATVTAVTTANSVLSLAGIESSTDALTDALFYLALTNATTITAARVGTASITAKVSYQLVEYYPNILKSKQEADIALNAAASNTATITAVTLAKSYLAWRGSETNGVGASQVLCQLTLTNTTTVTATKGAATNNTTAHGTVVEFR